MKQLVQIEEVEDGFETLLNQRVTVWCLNYIYAGTLAGVNETFIKLEDASVVYETGPLNTSGYKDAQKVPNPIYVHLSCVESYTLEV